MVHISALNGDENMIRTLYLARANATIQDNEGIFLMDFANLMKKIYFFKITNKSYSLKIGRGCLGILKIAIE